jgi:hypothetical protein
MADIHVVFTNQNGVVDVVAMPEIQPLIEEDMVFWHVRSEHPDIDEVEIEFDAPNAEFFEFKSANTTQHTRSYRKELKSRSSGKTAAGTTPRRWNRSALIWGQAPQYGKDRKPDKYWIKGFKKNGKVPIAELDPVIITTKPKP